MNRLVVLLLGVTVAACAGARSEECNTGEDCWDGLVCVGRKAECTGGCEGPENTCQRPCDDVTPCGPRDTCSDYTLPVRSSSDSVPTRICLPPKTDGGT